MLAEEFVFVCVCAVEVLADVEVVLVRGEVDVFAVDVVECLVVVGEVFVVEAVEGLAAVLVVVLVVELAVVVPVFADDEFVAVFVAVLVEVAAGFVVALTGDIMTMPGLPKVPAAEKIDVDENGRISGLF